MVVGMQITPVPDGARGAPNSPIVNLAAWSSEIRGKLNQLTVHLGDVTAHGGVIPKISIDSIRTTTRWSAGSAAAADQLWRETFAGTQAADLRDALLKDMLGTRLFSERSGIAPMIDSHLLSRELKADYRERVLMEVSSGKAGVDRLTKQINRLRKWSPLGSARDRVGEMIEGRELKQRQRQWVNAIGSYGGRLTPTLREIVSDIRGGNFSMARAWARYRAEQLDGLADPAIEAILAHLAAASGSKFDHAIEELAVAKNIRDDSEKPVDNGNDENRARRKFSSILTSPAIATLLGVNAEFRVPKSNWDKAVGSLKTVTYGAIGASLDGNAPGGQGWTAYVHGGEGGPNFFGPCDEAEALAHGPSATAAIVGGLVRLRVSDGGEPRYVLDVTDTVSSTSRRLDFATQSLSKLRAGEAPAESEPNPVGRGLTLIDRAIHAAAQKSNARQRQLRAKPDEHVNFAADLLQGYAVMFAIPRQQTPSLKSHATEWRTAMGRSVSFASTDQIDPAFVADSVSFERGFGIVNSVPVQQDTQDENGETKPVTSMPQELFSWHGGSLTVALPTESHSASASIQVSQDLAVSRTFNLPDEPEKGEVDYRPPPLRDGRGYLVGLAATYLGGWSLSVPDAAAAHAEDRYGHVLGDPTGAPFQFRRPDKLPAPLVLLPYDSPIVTMPSGKNLLGESLLTVVVRTGDSITSTSRRFVFPHAVDFDRAEQQDQFRGVREDKPPGAFRGDVGVLWREGGGSFPLAIGGDIATSPKVDLGNSRGQVLKFEDPQEQKKEYYPDGNSQFLRLHLAAQVPSDLTPPTMNTPAAFWADGQRPREAMPILLEVQRVKANPDKPRVAIESNMEFVDDVEVQRIVIALQPATTIVAALVAEPSPTTAIRQHQLGEILLSHVRSSKVDGGSAEDVAVEMLAALLARQVVSSLNGVQTIKFVHAQQRPDPPTFVVDESALTPVVVTVAADSSTTLDRKWIDVVRDRWAKHHTEYSHWESDEGGASCFFVGCAGIDPATTGKLRCEAQWKEHGPEYVKKSTEEIYRYEPGSGNALLFSLSDIDSSTIATRLDLLGDVESPRRLAHAFPDGRARRLTAILVASSRFAEYFRHPEDCESRSGPREIWVPCTFTPPPPTIANVSFMLDEDRRCDGRGRYSFTRTSRIRLELGDDVYTSGEDEKLGVLFRVDGTDPCDLFTPALEPYADAFTMEGRNPLHQSPTHGHLSPDRFRSGEPPVRGVLKAPIRNDDSVGPNLVPVDILPHTPLLDGERGFYCDIILDPQNSAQRITDLSVGASYMSFVHLGLARYQQHAVDGLQLSHAIGRDLWLLPWRHGSIEFTGKQNFTVRIEGPMVDENAETAPTLEITVMHNEARGRGAQYWMPASGDLDQLQVTDLRPVVANGKAIWEWQGRLPRSRTQFNYGIRIRELARQRDDDIGVVVSRRWTLNMTINLWSSRSPEPVEIVAALAKETELSS
jgi:hypothetical protein